MSNPYLEIKDRAAELDTAVAAAGLPAGASVEDLITHHRASASIAVAFEIGRAESDNKTEWGTIYEISSTKNTVRATHSLVHARALVENSPTDTGLVHRTVGPWLDENGNKVTYVR